MIRTISGRRTTLLLVLAAVVGSAAALLVGGLLNPQQASALTSVAATEAILSTATPIGFQADTVPVGNWTSLGTLTLNAGASYAVFARVGLRSYYTASPSSVSCLLSVPNEPPDVAEANFTGAKGSNIANLSFMALTSLIGSSTTGAATQTGSATLRCRVVGAGDMQVYAQHARLIALPVDSVANNLGTLYH